MTAQRRPKPTTITRIGVTNAIWSLSGATWFAARAEGCHAATGHFGANNIPNVIRCVGEAAHHLGLMLISPRNSEARVIDLEAGLAAALAREDALRAALKSLTEHPAFHPAYISKDLSDKLAAGRAALAVNP